MKSAECRVGHSVEAMGEGNWLCWTVYPRVARASRPWAIVFHPFGMLPAAVAKLGRVRGGRVAKDGSLAGFGQGSLRERSRVSTGMPRPSGALGEGGRCGGAGERFPGV